MNFAEFIDFSNKGRIQQLSVKLGDPQCNKPMSNHLTTKSPVLKESLKQQWSHAPIIFRSMLFSTNVLKIQQKHKFYIMSPA